MTQTMPPTVEPIQTSSTRVIPRRAARLSPGERLAVRGPGRDGRADGRPRLGYDSAGARVEVAAEPANGGRHLPEFALPDGDLVGSSPCGALQRRVGTDSRARQAPGPRTPRHGRVARTLAHHRAAVAKCARNRAGNVLRRPVLAGEALRLPGGGVLHLLLQRDP